MESGVLRRFEETQLLRCERSTIARCAITREAQASEAKQHHPPSRGFRDRRRDGEQPVGVAGGVDIEADDPPLVVDAVKRRAQNAVRIVQRNKRVEDGVEYEAIRFAQAVDLVTDRDAIVIQPKEGRRHRARHGE